MLDEVGRKSLGKQRFPGRGDGGWRPSTFSREVKGPECDDEGGILGTAVADGLGQARGAIPTARIPHEERQNGNGRNLDDLWSSGARTHLPTAVRAAGQSRVQFGGQADQREIIMKGQLEVPSPEALQEKEGQEQREQEIDDR